MKNRFRRLCAMALAMMMLMTMTAGVAEEALSLPVEAASVEGEALPEEMEEFDLPVVGKTLFPRPRR